MGEPNIPEGLGELSPYLCFATDVSGWSVGGLGVSSGVSGHAQCGVACGGQARPGLGRGGDTEDCKLEPAVRQSPGLGAVQSSLVTGATPGQCRHHMQTCRLVMRQGPLRGGNNLFVNNSLYPTTLDGQILLSM